MVRLMICFAIAAMQVLMAGSPAYAAAFSCTPTAADLDHPTPLQLSEDDRAVLEKSYRAPEVRGLRTAIETYLAGDARTRPATLLKGTPKVVLRNRFELMVDERGPFGGFFLVVQFKSHPETMYKAWVYDIGDEWDLRAWDTAHCSTAQQRWLRVRYGSMALSGSG